MIPLAPFLFMLAIRLWSGLQRRRGRPGLGLHSKVERQASESAWLGHDGWSCHGDFRGKLGRRPASGRGRRRSRRRNGSMGRDSAVLVYILIKQCGRLCGPMGRCGLGRRRSQRRSARRDPPIGRAMPWVARAAVSRRRPARARAISGRPEPGG